MATNIFEFPDKYFDILAWNVIYFIQKRPLILCFLLNFT